LVNTIEFIKREEICKKRKNRKRMKNQNSLEQITFKNLI